MTDSGAAYSAVYLAVLSRAGSLDARTIQILKNIRCDNVLCLWNRIFRRLVEILISRLLDFVADNANSSWNSRAGWIGL